MFEAGLVCSRFLHDAALIILFGTSLFPVYAFSSQAGDSALRLNRRLQRPLMMTSLVALLSGILWLLFTVANMTGTLSDALDWTTLWSVVSETAFGQLWTARLALIAVLVGLVEFQPAFLTRRQRLIVPMLSAAVLASLAGVGHTQDNEGMSRAVQIGADSAHLLGAGAWLGGLLPLAFILEMARPLSSKDDGLDVGDVLLRFSGMGLVAVAVLAGTGLLNSLFLVGSFANLVQTPYGQLLLVKLSLFTGMVSLAALNRYWLVPSLMGNTAAGQPASTLARLQWHVIGEQVLGLLVVLIVSALGTMEPAINSSSIVS
jgi:putative copper resistance protein D